ncbi:MAG TPA: cytochrome c [Polyangiaceae bacterium]
MVLALTSGLLGCKDGRIDLERMLDQPKFEPYEAGLVPGTTSMRHPPEGSVDRDAPLGPPELVDGRDGEAYATHIPIPIDEAQLSRGRERFGIFCAPCHGLLGDGRSQVAENMRLRPPPSLHEARLREYPPGRIYSVVHEGYGLMPSYAQELALRDRWAVVAYVRALQLSQSVRLAELPAGLAEKAQPWLK